MVTIYAIDWVRTEALWHVDILNRSKKKDEPDPPAGPDTEIYARDMTPDQIGQRIGQRLRDYVTQLESGGEKPKAAESAKPPAEGSKQ